MLCEYSAAERKLIEKISPEMFFSIDKTYIAPTILYQNLVLRVFMNKQQGNHVEALWRAADALFNSKVYRMTPEFDKLCEFE